MKKLFIVLFLSIIFTSGCNNIIDSPTGVVENYLGNYQRLDKNVIKDLEETINKDKNMDKDQKEEYKILLEKQYQNLSYKITNEEVYETSAIVDVQIEVLDYQSAVYKAKKYYDNEIKKDNEEIDYEKEKKYIDYKIKKMKEVNDKVKYKITINLTNNEGIWTIDELSEIDKKKIHGLY